MGSYTYEFSTEELYMIADCVFHESLKVSALKRREYTQMIEKLLGPFIEEEQKRVDEYNAAKKEYCDAKKHRHN